MGQTIRNGEREKIQIEEEKKNDENARVFVSDVPATLLFLSRTIESLVGDLSAKFADLLAVFRRLILILPELRGF